MSFKDIKIHYFSDEQPRLNKISKGDLIDLSIAEDIDMKAGEFKLIPLGVSMKLPAGYEAWVIPRSSLFKKTGILQANSVGLIDCSYSGTDDQWMFPAYATRDIHVDKFTRICQFRIFENQPSINFIECENLDEIGRGGFGSTGEK